jgi:hypothetical protein
MPKLAHPLSDVQVRNAKPRSARYKLADGGGLFLEVNPTGSRIWRRSYVQASGKKNVLTFGAYPAVSLADARANGAEARQDRGWHRPRADCPRVARQQSGKLEGEHVHERPAQTGTRHLPANRQAFDRGHQSALNRHEFARCIAPDRKAWRACDAP